MKALTLVFSFSFSWLDTQTPGLILERSYSSTNGICLTSCNMTLVLIFLPISSWIGMQFLSPVCIFFRSCRLSRVGLGLLCVLCCCLSKLSSLIFFLTLCLPFTLSRMLGFLILSALEILAFWCGFFFFLYKTSRSTLLPQWFFYLPQHDKNKCPMIYNIITEKLESFEEKKSFGGVGKSTVITKELRTWYI